VIGGTLLAGELGPLIGSAVGMLVLGVMYVLTTRDGGIRPGMTTIITGGILRAIEVGQR
jgi:ribose/xylose/arabinose/galactoside ABC-type transport system permease subunit